MGVRSLINARTDKSYFYQGNGTNENEGTSAYEMKNGDANKKEALL